MHVADVGHRLIAWKIGQILVDLADHDKVVNRFALSRLDGSALICDGVMAKVMMPRRLK